jgi:hypothetical protein
MYEADLTMTTFFYDAYQYHWPSHSQDAMNGAISNSFITC